MTKFKSLEEKNVTVVVINMIYVVINKYQINKVKQLIHLAMKTNNGGIQ